MKSHDGGVESIAAYPQARSDTTPEFVEQGDGNHPGTDNHCHGMIPSDE